MNINELHAWLQEKKKHIESLVQAQRLEQILGYLLATGRWGDPFLPAAYETMESPLLGVFGVYFCSARLWLIMDKINCRLEGEGWTLHSTLGPDTSASLFNLLQSGSPLYQSQ